MPHAKSLVLKRSLKKRGGRINLRKGYRDVKSGLKKGVRFADRHKGKIAAGALAAGAVAMGAPYALPALKTAGGALAAKAGDIALAGKEVAKTELKKGVASLMKEGGKGIQGQIVKYASQGAGQSLIDSVGGKDNFEKIIKQALNDIKENMQEAMAEKEREKAKKRKVVKEKTSVGKDEPMIPNAQDLPKEMQQVPVKEIPEVIRRG
jgi:phage-related tail protein